MSTSGNSGQRSVKVAATTSAVASTSKSTDDASEEHAGPSSPGSVLKLLRDHVTKVQDVSEPICTMIEQMEVKYKAFSNYWISRSIAYRKLGNNDKSLEALSTGADEATDDKEELHMMIEELDEQVAVTENVVPQETRVGAKQQSSLPRELFNIAQESVFPSTVIKYKVYEIKHPCTSVTTTPRGSKPTPKIVITPVRRSSRNASQRRDDLVPPGVLYKPNPAIGDLD